MLPRQEMMPQSHIREQMFVFVMATGPRDAGGENPERCERFRLWRCSDPSYMWIGVRPRLSAELRRMLGCRGGGACAPLIHQWEVELYSISYGLSAP